MGKLKGLGRYIFCIAVLFLVFCVYGLRLIDWQIVNGKEILEESTKTNTSAVKMEAARGEILDANGVPLAVNKTGYSIVFDKVYMTAETQNKTILQLISLLDKRGEEWEDVLPIQTDAAGTYSFIPGMEDEAEALKKDSSIRLNSYSTADECMKTMVELYDCEGYSPQDTRDIVSVRYNMAKLGFSVSSPYTFARSVSADTVGIVSENKQNLPGATIQITTERDYPNGTIAPHIVGTMGFISQEEYNSYKASGNTYSLDNVSGYSYTDRIGKSGVEGALEDQLRGKNGKKVIETTRTGSLASSTVMEAPVAGNTVYLSIDSRLQAVAQASVAKNVQAAQEYGKDMVAKKGGSGYGEDCTVGAAVILDVKSFKVLAAATYPNYDLQKYTSDTDYRRALLVDETNPLYNSAFLGAFMPGSSFKPVVACAALQEGIITPSSTYFCNHTYDFWDDYRPTCMGYHGNLNVIGALQKSCNLYFFDAGRRLNIKNMELYAQRFGFGQKTGLEVNEGVGLISSPEEREKRGGVWNGGDVVQAAIGQADDASTPIQLATYVATLVNGGERLKTSVVDKITNYTRDQIVQQAEPEVRDNIGVSQENIDIVKAGMRAVCQPGGTAAATFSNYGIAVAGKTGTAQVPPHSDNVVFVGFAPYDDPEIAIAVVLQYGATSKFSNAVAKDLFDAYFYGTAVDAAGDIVKPVGTIPQNAESSQENSVDGGSSVDSVPELDP